ncbi:MAG: HAD-IB family hydrolase [Bacteroidota bacterium]
MKKRLVLFDFDGTITTDDTLLKFIHFYHGSFRFLTGFTILSPILALHLLKLIPNWRAKEIVLAWFFKGRDIKTFNQKCLEFADLIDTTMVRAMAMKKIRQLVNDQSTVVIVSASAENWVRPWCEKHSLHCIATRLEVINGRLTGKIAGKNCYGPEKESRIRAQFDILEYPEIIAYGDSRGDREMLALASKKHYKPFRD